MYKVHILTIIFRSCVIGHACQNNCFFVLLSWMPMYFHDTFPEVKVINY